MLDVQKLRTEYLERLEKGGFENFLRDFLQRMNLDVEESLKILALSHACGLWGWERAKETVERAFQEVDDSDIAVGRALTDLDLLKHERIEPWFNRKSLEEERKKCEKELAKRYREAGLSFREIGELLNRSKSTVHGWLANE